MTRNNTPTQQDRYSDRDRDRQAKGGGGRRRGITPAVAEQIDYKNPDLLRQFITERGKIIPRRVSGLTARQQRRLAVAVRRARMVALLPYTVTGR